MKKFLAALLAVLMVVSISVSAFADTSDDDKKKESPTQDTSGDSGGYYWADAPKATATNKDEADAEKAEAQAAKAIEKAVAEDNVIIALGKLPANATAEMKADFSKLEDALVDGKKALGNDESAAIPADVKADAVDGAKVVAGPAFRAVAASYPATITIAVENPEDFLGMMTFVNGKWVKLATVVNDDGTVTFILEEPSVLSIVSQVVEAA